MYVYFNIYASENILFIIVIQIKSSFDINLYFRSCYYHIYHTHRKDAGRYCFDRCVFVNREKCTPWSLVLSPFPGLWSQVASFPREYPLFCLGVPVVLLTGAHVLAGATPCLGGGGYPNLGAGTSIAQN